MEDVVQGKDEEGTVTKKQANSIGLRGGVTVSGPFFIVQRVHVGRVGEEEMRKRKYAWISVYHSFSLFHILLQCRFFLHRSSSFYCHVF